MLYLQRNQKKMFYEWSLEIVNLRTGEMRNLTYQGNLKEVFNYLKKLEENKWELLEMKKRWTGK